MKLKCCRPEIGAKQGPQTDSKHFYNRFLSSAVHFEVMLKEKMWNHLKNAKADDVKQDFGLLQGIICWIWSLLFQVMPE